MLIQFTSFVRSTCVIGKTVQFIFSMFSVIYLICIIYLLVKCTALYLLYISQLYCDALYSVQQALQYKKLPSHCVYITVRYMCFCNVFIIVTNRLQNSYVQFRTLLYCTALHCTALHCTALHCTALHCTALHCTVLHCTVLTIAIPVYTNPLKPSSLGMVNWLFNFFLFSPTFFPFLADGVKLLFIFHFS